MKIEDEIAAVLDGIAADPDHKTWDELADWTREVLGRLAALGKRHDYLTYATSEPEPADGGEWLYDLTWLKYSHNTLLEVGLVLESEWDFRDDSIREDFQKLLLARAQLRVMVFQATDLTHRRKHTARFKQWISAFTGSAPGDRYLFCCFNGDTERFEHEPFTLP